MENNKNNTTIHDIESKIAHLKRCIKITERDLITGDNPYTQKTIIDTQFKFKEQLKEARSKLKELKAQTPCKNEDIIHVQPPGKKENPEDDKDAIIDNLRRIIDDKCAIINTYMEDNYKLQEEIKIIDQRYKVLVNLITSLRKELKISNETAQLVVKDGYDQQVIIDKLEHTIKAKDAEIENIDKIRKVQVDLITGLREELEIMDSNLELTINGHNKLKLSYNELIEKMNDISSMSLSEFKSYKKNPFVYNKLKI